MGVFRRNGSYWIDYYAHGRRVRRKVGPSKTLANLAMKKIEIDIAQGKYLDIKEETKLKFKDFAQMYIEAYATKKRSWESTDKHYLKRLVPFFGEKYLQDITPFSVQKYQSMRRQAISHRGRVTSPAYVNRELACLKCMFRLAIEWGHAKENPVIKVKFEKENNKLVRFLEKDELRRLLHYSDEALKPIITIAVNTGMRSSEIRFLKWGDVDLLRGIITLTVTKNGETRRVPINKTVKEMLFGLPKNGPDSYVFSNRDGMPYDFTWHFQQALKRAGIKNFRFHDLRHTAASYLAMAGVDLNTIREILGHKSLEMVLRYAHLSPGHQANAVGALDSQLVTIWSPEPNSVKEDSDLYIHKAMVS